MSDQVTLLQRWRRDVRAKLLSMADAWLKTIKESNLELQREDIPAWRRRELETAVLRGSAIGEAITFFSNELDRLPVPEEPMFDDTK